MGALRAFATHVNGNRRLIDYFALVLGHGLLVVAFLRLVADDALDEEVLIAKPEEGEADEQDAPRRYRSGRRVRR